MLVGIHLDTGRHADTSGQYTSCAILFLSAISFQ